MYSFWTQAWAICRKDVRVWLQHRANVMITLLPGVALLLISAIGAAAVGKSPVALVQQDSSPQAVQMAQILHQSGSFRLTDASPQQAQLLLQHLDVVAIITIPSDFSQRVQAEQPSPLDVTINNLNLDFTNDIRRSVPDAITTFYNDEGVSNPIKVDLHETDLRQQDIEIFQYTVLPTIVFMLTISGLVTGGLATAREWETQTIKELLLAPVASLAVIVGKVIGSFLITFVLGIVVLSLIYLLGWLHPLGYSWLTALLILALISLMSSGLGIAVDMLIKRVQPLSPVAINVGMYLFFLAGGIGVLAFDPAILQDIAVFIPLTYGRHALEMALFYNSTDLLGRDITVLAISTVVALGLGALALRRGIAR